MSVAFLTWDIYVVRKFIGRTIIRKSQSYRRKGYCTSEHSSGEAFRLPCLGGVCLTDCTISSKSSVFALLSNSKVKIFFFGGGWWNCRMMSKLCFNSIQQSNTNDKITCIFLFVSKFLLKQMINFNRREIKEQRNSIFRKEENEVIW